MMHPEQHTASSALQRRRADSSPRGTPSTGLLQGLLLNARPPFFCFLVPRVHAADVAASQPAQMPSPPPPPVHIPSPSSMPSHMIKPEFPNTGWERIKELFDRNEGQKYPEEITNVIKFSLCGAVAGLIYGGLPAARHARQRYIHVSQAELYTGRVDAVRSAHNAAIRGFVRYGWRWSWRVSLIVTVFKAVSTGLSVYQDKDAVSQYAAAGAVTGGFFRLNLGLRGLVAGSVIGALLGAPAGALVIGLESLTGETTRERRKRERREQYELRLAEWTARLQLTDELIGSLTVSSQAEAIDKDMQRIQELLSLPPNKDESSQ